MRPDATTTSRSGAASGQPRLRLVRDEEAVQASPVRRQVIKKQVKNPMRQPLRGADDARWVLAVRAASALQGSVLRPEHRERLMRVGRNLGLTPFDASLVIVIVQDQARRGYDAEYCPTAGQPQLELVNPPQRPKRSALHWWSIVGCAAGILALELLLFRAWLF